MRQFSFSLWTSNEWATLSTDSVNVSSVNMFNTELRDEGEKHRDEQLLDTP